MSVTYFQPEVWSATLLSILAKSLVFAGSPCVNRDYEGEISAFGDTVHITNVADVNIFAYAKDNDLTAPQALTDAEQLLQINQALAFNFEIDDIDMRQVRSGGALMAEAAKRAAFGLADKADQYVANLMAVGSTNPIGLVDASSAAGNVYDNLIVPAGILLDQNNVPQDGRFMVVPPSVYGKLLKDTRFIHLNESGMATLSNGIVGTVDGFSVVKSNNAPQANRAITSSIAVATTAKTLTSTTQVFTQGDVGLVVAGTNITGGTTIASVSADGKVATMSAVGTSAGAITDLVISGGGQLAIAGSSIATSYAEQISKVEAYRPQLRFADALKGLHLYGGKVLRPQALVVASVKVA